MRATDGRSLLTLAIVLAVILVLAVGGYVLLHEGPSVTPASNGATLSTSRDS